MNGPWPLIADIGDVIGFLIFVVFLIISVVGSLANKWRQMQEEAARRARPQRPPRQPRPLDDEIADFLRTAGEHREAGQRRPGGAPVGTTPPRPAPSRPGAPLPSRPATPPPRPPVEQPLEVIPLEPRPRHLAESLATRTLTTGSLGQLTTNVAEADDRLEDHLRQVFRRDLSSLGAGEEKAVSAPAAPLPSTAAVGLAAMLASGDNLRNAIILSEIINRPEHRWS